MILLYKTESIAIVQILEFEFTTRNRQKKVFFLKKTENGPMFSVH